MVSPTLPNQTNECCEHGGIEKMEVRLASKIINKQCYYLTNDNSRYTWINPQEDFLVILVPFHLFL